MFAVIMKELRVLLRSRKAFSFLLLALLLVGGFFVLAWVNVSSDIDSPNARARVGRSLFMIFSAVQLCAMGLIAPLMAASSVTIERENKTMELLIATGLSRIKMLLGKWFSTVFYEVMLALCLLPILSLVFQLGGIGLDEYVFAALMTTVTVFTYGMVGLACSCVFRKSVTALFVALLIVLFLGGGLNLGLLMIRQWFNYQFEIDPTTSTYNNMLVRYLFWSVSPVVNWVEHLVELENTRRTSLGAGSVFFNSIHLWHLVFQALLFLGAFRVAVLGIRRREVEKVAPPTHQIDDPAELARRRKRWPYYLIDPLRRTQVIADGHNPIYVKEQRVGALARPQVLFRMTYLCLPLSFFLFKSALEINSLDFIFNAVGFTLTLIMLFVPIFAATMISREREEKTIDLLATTTLSSGRIIRAKFFVVLRFAAVIAASLTIFPLGLRAVRAADWFSGTMSFSTMLDRIFWNCLVEAGIIGVLVASFSALYAALCLYFSSIQRRNVGAIVISYLVFGLFCMLPIFGLMFFELKRMPWGHGDCFKPFFELFFQGIAPLLSYIHFLTFDSPSDHQHWFVFWQGDHFKTSWGDANLVLGHALLVFGLTALLLYLASRRLRKEMR